MTLHLLTLYICIPCRSPRSRTPNPPHPSSSSPRGEEEEEEGGVGDNNTRPHRRRTDPLLRSSCSPPVSSSPPGGLRRDPHPDHHHPHRPEGSTLSVAVAGGTTGEGDGADVATRARPRTTSGVTTRLTSYGGGIGSPRSDVQVKEITSGNMEMDLEKRRLETMRQRARFTSASSRLSSRRYIPITMNTTTTTTTTMKTTTTTIYSSFFLLLCCSSRPGTSHLRRTTSDTGQPPNPLPQRVVARATTSPAVGEGATHDDDHHHHHHRDIRKEGEDSTTTTTNNNNNPKILLDFGGGTTPRETDGRRRLSSSPSTPAPAPAPPPPAHALFHPAIQRLGSPVEQDRQEAERRLGSRLDHHHHDHPPSSARRPFASGSRPPAYGGEEEGEGEARGAGEREREKKKKKGPVIRSYQAVAGIHRAMRPARGMSHRQAPMVVENAGKEYKRRLGTQVRHINHDIEED